MLLLKVSPVFKRIARNCYEFTRYRKKPKTGERILQDNSNVLLFNSWDNVEWGEKQELDALAAVAKNSEVILAPEDLHKLEQEAALNWDKFYGVHQNKFFKNRNWLFTEFPELAPHLSESFPLKIQPKSNELGSDNSSCDATQSGSGKSPSIDPAESSSGKDESSSPTLQSDYACSRVINKNSTSKLSAQSSSHEVSGSSPPDCHSQSQEGMDSVFPGLSAQYRILEIGCGVGNTIFPLLQTNNDPGLFVYGGDFSATAIDIIQKHQEYDTRRCNVFVLDVTNEEWSVPFPPNSLDVISCIYMLSAIHPDKHHHVARQVQRYLKPGGVLLFRDYGRYDLAQLRFKKGKCLAENYYMRGDGTKSYFFTQDEIRDTFVSAGLVEKQNIVDRRLQVNRGKQITMYRVWVQAKYTKPLLE